MRLLQDFMDFAIEQGVNTEDIYQDSGENYEILSFGEQAEDETIYNVTLVFYEDENTVEIYIRKQIDDTNLFEVLQKINALNAEYIGISFFVDDNIISCKSVSYSNGNVENVIRQMVENMQVASAEFVKFH